MSGPTLFHRTLGLLRSRGGLFTLGALLVTALVCAFVPLADHLGFELAMVLTIASALASPVAGVAAIRTERLRPAGDRQFGMAAIAAALVGIMGLIAAALLILLNGVRRPTCEPLSGAVWLLLLPLPTTFLAAGLGAFAGTIARTTKGVVAWLVFIELGTLLWSLSTLYWGPAFFLFDHLFGYFPGPLYDEVVVISPALLVFRGLTLLWAGVAILAASAAGQGRTSRLVGALLLAFLCLGISGRWGASLGFRSTDASVSEALGGLKNIDDLEVHYPREWSEKTVEQFLHDAAFRAHQVVAALGIKPTHTVRVWVYRNADEKRRLVGASGTSFSKPWRHEVHVNASGFPHPVIRHELVHAFGAEIAPGAFHVPGGLFPNTPLIEGFAVAFDDENDGMTLLQWAKAMRAAHLAPNIPALLSASAFFEAAPARAYSYAGAFIRFLHQRFGLEKARELYASGDLRKLGDPQALVADFEKQLDGIEITASEKAMAERRYSRPSVFHRQCAREVSQITDEAQDLLGEGRTDQALSKYQQACSMEPDDPALLRSLMNAAIRAKNAELRDQTAAALLAHPKLDPSLKAAALNDLGDDAWKHDRLDESARRYAEAAALPVDAATHRNAVAHLDAVRSPERARVLKPLFVEGSTDVAQLFRMSDYVTAHPDDGLVAYLLARQFAQRDAAERALPLLKQAREHGLSDPQMQREDLRMTARTAAERHQCDDAAATIPLLERVIRSESDRQYVEDWVERCRYEVQRGWPTL